MTYQTDSRSHVLGVFLPRPARDEIERAAIAMGILDQARRNAEAGIRSLLETLGVKSVSVSSAAGKT
jgi:hypothetical protein